MAVLPCLQNLPFHVAKKIALCIAEGRGTSSSHQRLQPLLGICRSWREIALVIKYATWEVSLENKPYFSCEVNEEKLSLTKYAIQNYSCYAQSVLVKFSYDGIVDQSAVEKVRACMDAEVCFQRARLLNIKIKSANNSFASTDTTDFSEKFKILLMYTSKMIPFATQNSLLVGDNLSEDFTIGTKQAESLAQYVLSSNMFTRINIGYIIDQHARRIGFGTELSQFSCQWDKNFDIVARVIHVNSNSLLTLGIHYICFDGFKRLFVDPENRPVTYTNLDILSLSGNPGIKAEILPPIEDAVPFPRLSHLDINIDYPFSDDILFRGNSTTLKGMLITKYYKLINALVNDGILLKTKLKALESLSILSCRNPQGNKKISSNTYKSLFTAILYRIKNLYLIAPGPTNEFVNFVLSSNRYYYIQTLTLKERRLSLYECIKILEYLPALQCMTSTVSKFGSEFNSMSVLDIAKSIRQNHSGLSQNLQAWIYASPENVSAQIISAVILLLASVCSNLHSVDIVKRHKSITDHVFTKLVSPRLYADLKRAIVPAIKPVLLYSSTFTSIRINREMPPAAKLAF